MKLRILTALVALAFATTALAVEPGEQLSDPRQEARARALSAELRCLVCQNQSIDDSNAPLAKDLRVLVREQITAGKTDAQVIGYVVARYGEFVLLRPRFTWSTALLWLAPLLLLGVTGYALHSRARLPAAGMQAAPLSDAEEKRLKRLLDDQT
jgi:cytochrome c-type biogenesis protein CcmH